MKLQYTLLLLTLQTQSWTQPHSGGSSEIKEAIAVYVWLIFLKLVLKRR